jgi:cyclic pyranopterin phosphate synthase
MKEDKKLSHIGEQGEARMVDVGGKPVTDRLAKAAATVTMSADTVRLLQEKALPKGDVLSVARVAGIMAAKRTAGLIPMCHPLNIEQVQVDFRIEPEAVTAEVTVSLSGKTGVEMEALTAASVAALTIYDMCKAVDRGMMIGDIKVVEKRGGRSGLWRA